MTIANAAHALIKARGRTMTYKVITFGEYDSATGEATVTEKAVSVHGVVVTTDTTREGEGDPAITIRRRVIVSGLAGVTPKLEDRIKIALDDYIITAIRSAEIAGGVTVVYDLDVVRA